MNYILKVNLYYSLFRYQSQNNSQLNPILRNIISILKGMPIFFAATVLSFHRFILFRFLAQKIFRYEFSSACWKKILRIIINTRSKRI